MKNKINENFKEKYLNFLDTLKKNNIYQYYPVKYGYTKEGSGIELGLSCFAIKSLYILDEWKNISSEEKNNWLKFINEFQNNKKNNFQDGSFIDNGYFDNIIKLSPLKETKRTIKKVIYGKSNIKSKNEEVSEFIRAETKQAIATLYQVGSHNNKKYHDKYFYHGNVTDYLNTLDWSKPWNAGAQFSALCVFLETQEIENHLYNEIKKELVSFSDNLIDYETGAYFKNNIPKKTELVNGAMKVLTGLDWLDESIHEPNKLIDTCLGITPDGYGCDIVDIVYVLYRCSNNNDYKKNEINSYFNSIEEMIFDHYFSDSGGFSYYVGKSQLYYYGLNITKGLNEADIHGSTLLLWALSMIYDFRESTTIKLNILKP